MNKALHILLLMSFFYASSYVAVSGEIATVLLKQTDYEQEKNFIIPAQSPAKMDIWSKKLDELLQTPHNNLELDIEDLKAVSDLYIHSDAEYSKKLARFTKTLSDVAQVELLPLVLGKRAPYGKIYETMNVDKVEQAKSFEDAAVDIHDLLRKNMFEESIFAHHAAYKHRTDGFELSPEKEVASVDVPVNVPYDLVYYEPHVEKLQDYNGPNFDQEDCCLKGPSIKGFEDSLGYRIYKPKNPNSVILLALYGGADVSWQDDPVMAKSYFTLKPEREIYRYFLDQGVTVIDLCNTPDLYKNTAHQSEMAEIQFKDVLQAIGSFFKSNVYEDLKRVLREQNNGINPQLYLFGASFGGLTAARFAEEYGRIHAPKNQMPSDVSEQESSPNLWNQRFNLPFLPELKGIISWNGALGKHDALHLNPAHDDNIQFLNVPAKILISSHDNQVLPSEFLQFYEQTKKHRKESLLDVSIVRKANTQLPERMSLFSFYLGHLMEPNAFPYIKRFIQKNKQDNPLRNAVNESLAKKATLQKPVLKDMVSIADYMAAEFPHAAYIAYDFYTYNKKRKSTQTAEEDLRHELSKAYMKLCVQAIGKLKWKSVSSFDFKASKETSEESLKLFIAQSQNGENDFDQYYKTLYGKLSKKDMESLHQKIKAKIKRTLGEVGFKPHLIDAFLNSEELIKKTNTLIGLVTNPADMVRFFFITRLVSQGAMQPQSLDSYVFSPLMVDALWEALGEVVLPYVETEAPDLYQMMHRDVSKAMQETLGSQVTLLQGMVREKIKRNKGKDKVHPSAEKRVAAY